MIFLIQILDRKLIYQREFEKLVTARGDEQATSNRGMAGKLEMNSEQFVFGALPTHIHTRMHICTRKQVHGKLG